MWSDTPKRERAVLVEIFVEQFQGARFGMQNIQPAARQVAGESSGLQYTALLDPVYIFKGKLSAAAKRGKFHDSADLRWLEERFNARLQQGREEFNLDYVGLAIKRYPELEMLFIRINVDVNAAKLRVAPLALNKLPPPARGDVQMGLLAPAGSALL
ncbi:hypothetical protein VE02_07583 [Pseudogymnoascus sp. 03VT05]|nr:hypothetical protein VE02_07583 [Pseudogymnoascus sp. 03VT05]